MFHKINPRDLLPVMMIVGLATGFGVGLSHGVPAVQALENRLADYRFATLAPAEPQNERIVVIAITEQTLATLSYRSPVDRGFLAGLLSHLDTAGAAAIGIDILFDQATEPEKDRTLRDVLLGMKTPVVLATAGKGFQLTRPQESFFKAFSNGLNTGIVNFIKDSNDGTVRWILAGQKYGGRFLPGFVRAMAEAAGAEQPTRDILLAYRAPPNAETPPFRVFPAHTAQFLPKDWFAGKIILIGADLPLTDRHRTPFAAAFGAARGEIPGIVIHAHALAQVLEGRLAPHLGLAEVVVIALALALLGMTVAALDVPTPVKIGALAVIVAGYWVGGFAAYGAAEIPLPLISPSVAFATAWGGGVAFLGRLDRQQKRYIRQAFSQYVAPAVVDQLVADPEQLKIGGERREMTFLFTDMANFTSLTENTEPEALVALLHEYMEGMLGIVFRHGATLDKLIGDAVVAFFNAPIEQADHRSRAVACALEMDAFGQRFVEKQAAKGKSVGITRIGVHTGIATIGNFGSSDFFDYTGLGDVVNTAARLEGANKYLGIRVCVSETTVSGCPDLLSRPIGTLVLKGKTEGIDVYEPLSPERNGSEAIAVYAEAMTMLRDDDPLAIETFRRVLALDPADALAAFHLNRLESGDTGSRIVMEGK